MLDAIEISSDQQRRLRELMRVFLEENAKINLSAYREEEACWVGNILDSIAGADVIEPEKGSGSGSEMRVMDVGIGGGFPLLPLAVLFPQIEFSGIDATRKKIDAVQRIVDQVGLTNVRLYLGRVEELGRDVLHREQYDVCISRAVAPLNVLLEYMNPFVNVGGKLLCWKSLSIEDELKESVHAAKELQCALVGHHRYELPGDWGSRQILIYEKTGQLGNQYPRGVGEPKKMPL